MNPTAGPDRFRTRVLLSGGIDSAACVRFYVRLGHDVDALHISYGQGAASAEKDSAIAIAAHYQIRLQLLTISGLAVPPAGEITGRNAVLISAALLAGGARAQNIAIGIHAGTPYYDCGPGFVGVCETLLDGYSDGRVKLGVPFLAWSKADIWGFCLEQGVPVALTWSCEASSIGPCGRCPSCRDREVLLAGA